jgi:hypothetical protein
LPNKPSDTKISEELREEILKLNTENMKRAHDSFLESQKAEKQNRKKGKSKSTAKPSPGPKGVG